MKIERAMPTVRPQMKNKKKGYPTYDKSKTKRENKQEKQEPQQNPRPTETTGNNIILKI